jgi:serine phosphatase RsbU (regulator of sigma subunit)
MANLQATLRAEFARGGFDLPRRLAAVNALFFVSTVFEHYATLFFGCYDDARRRFVYANCGYNPRSSWADGSCERLPPTAPVLGCWPSGFARRRRSRHRRGDTLVVFSDGVTEASNARDEEFGEARLVETVRREGPGPVASLPPAILAAVEEFTGAPHEDDLTLVVARGR